MSSITYKVEFFDYWHTGSGLSGNTYADGIVNKNDDGLPVIPGKTIKGLLHEAADVLSAYDSSLVSASFIETVFGKAEKEPLCHFTNVTLSKKLADNILNKGNQQALFQVITSTAIDEDGQAKEGSLRQLEVTIPLVLYGTIEDVPNSLDDKEFENCFKWVKHLGVNRNRGLGRCQISIVK
jgi:hypothetical protein